MGSWLDVDDVARAWLGLDKFMEDVVGPVLACLGECAWGHAAGRMFLRIRAVGCVFWGVFSGMLDCFAHVCILFRGRCQALFASLFYVLSCRPAYPFLP